MSPPEGVTANIIESSRRLSQSDSRHVFEGADMPNKYDLRWHDEYKNRKSIIHEFRTYIDWASPCGRTPDRPVCRSPSAAGTSFGQHAVTALPRYFARAAAGGATRSTSDKAIEPPSNGPAVGDRLEGPPIFWGGPFLLSVAISRNSAASGGRLMASDGLSESMWPRRGAAVLSPLTAFLALRPLEGWRRGVVRPPACSNS